MAGNHKKWAGEDQVKGRFIPPRRVAAEEVQTAVGWRAEQQ